MAKFNPILGTASGKLGDIVLYRANGAQLSRVRVRSVKNPKTQAQALQRMVFATASAARTALAAIIDHSFQSVKYGQKSVQYFMKRATDDLRVNALACMELTPTDQVKLANFNVKGVSAMAINSLLISQGSLRPYEIIRIGVDVPAVSTNPIPVVGEGDSGEPQIYLGDFIRGMGLKPGQQCTFVRVRVLDDQAPLAGEYPGEGAIDENSLWDWQFATGVDIFRFRVDPNITDAQATALMPTGDGTIKVVNGNGLIVDRPFEMFWQYDNDEENIVAIRPSSDYEAGTGAGNYAALAAIRSELVNGQWQRSTQRLVWFTESGNKRVSGASMYAALPTYMNGVSVTDSDKLLNYEDLESADMENHAPGGVAPGTGGEAQGVIGKYFDETSSLYFLAVRDTSGLGAPILLLSKNEASSSGDLLLFKDSYVGKLLKNISFKASSATAPAAGSWQPVAWGGFGNYVVEDTIISL